MVERTRYMLDEDKIPRAWYNISADLPVPQAPPLHPGTHQPLGPADLAPLFPMALIMQEVSTEREIEIPEPVRDALQAVPTRARSSAPCGSRRRSTLRPTSTTSTRASARPAATSPTRRSRRPSTTSRRASSASPPRPAPASGAAPWPIAGAMFGLEVKVYMVRASYDQKPYRRLMMETYGASVVASPSTETEAGRAILAEHPDSPGSLGIAISEAVEDAVKRDDTHYSLGSVLNHVLLHQTVIGLESIKQMEMAGEEPDVIIACAGGGSNFARHRLPVAGPDVRGGRKYQVIAVEPQAAPSLTRGRYMYDYGDTAKTGADGQDVHARPRLHPGADPRRRAALPRHVAAGQPAQARGFIEARSVHQRPCFEAGVQFARTEGIIPAPESTHAIRAAIDEALAAKKTGEKRVILFNLSGHGYFDLTSYQRYLSRRARGLRVPGRGGQARARGRRGQTAEPLEQRKEPRPARLFDFRDGSTGRAADRWRRR